MLFYDESLKEDIETATKLQEMMGDKLHQYHRLDENLERLADWVHEENGGSHCVLYKDFAPYSFYFELFVHGERYGKQGMTKSDYLVQRYPMLEGYTRLFNGGLIYSGPGYPDDGSGPSFSVNITPTTGWSIHT